MKTWDVHRVSPSRSFVASASGGGNARGETAYEACEVLLRKYPDIMRPGVYVFTPVGGCGTGDRAPYVLRVEEVPQPRVVIREID